MAKSLTTKEVLNILKEGQKAFVTNHIGYKAHLVKLPDGEFEWRYPPQNYKSEFNILERGINKLKWRIEE
ncbi:hypothetical protein D3C81_1291400 [compost metagenome]